MVCRGPLRRRDHWQRSGSGTLRRRGRRRAGLATSWWPWLSIIAISRSGAAPAGVWRWSSRRAERPAVYEKDREALIALWEASDRICSKRLKPLIPVLLPALERHGRIRVDDE